MNSLTDNDREYGDERSGGDREISLGTATILGIFFALALVCAAFFGFGYTLGRKSGQEAGTVPVAAAAGGNGGAKPSAASGKDPYAVPVVAGGAQAGRDVVVPLPAPVSRLAPVEKADAAADAPADVEPPKTKAAVAAPAAALPPIPATAPGGAFMVQVAAVSSQEIADIELSALKKKGYDVAVRHEPQDKLLHVQIGPFATRKDADAMRVRVLSDGFNAIVK